MEPLLWSISHTQSLFSDFYLWLCSPSHSMWVLCFQDLHCFQFSYLGIKGSIFFTKSCCVLSVIALPTRGHHSDIENLEAPWRSLGHSELWVEPPSYLSTSELSDIIFSDVGLHQLLISPPRLLWCLLLLSPACLFLIFCYLKTKQAPYNLLCCYYWAVADHLGS